MAYTENARGMIFTAREEAMHYGSPYIESEHLLLGILRESEMLVKRMDGETGSLNSFRKEIEAMTQIGPSVTGLRELPLSADSKQIFNFAAEEAGDLGHNQIALSHFLLGVLRVQECMAARILLAHGAGQSRLCAKKRFETCDGQGDPALF